VVVGITDYAQQQLGDIVFVELPEVGACFAKGDTFGVIESVKAVSDLSAPVSGEVVDLRITRDVFVSSIRGLLYSTEISALLPLLVEQALAGDDAWGYVKALDVRTGDVQWEYRVLSPLWNGVMATAGGLVFGATNEGNFFALDAETGASLWDFQAGAAARSNPSSFELDGRQRVVMHAGNAVFVLSLPD